MVSRHRGRSSKQKELATADAIRAAVYETLESRLLLAYVNVNTEQPAQTIAGIGGNYAAGRYGAGSVNDNVGIYTLNNLSPKHARIGIPLLDWEATNDNSDPNSFNWSGFKQTGGSLNVLQLMSDLKTRGIPISAAVWDAPNWMITSATQGSTNFRVVDPSKYTEFVESIAAYLVKARDTYGVTVDSVSINESDGGYRLKFTSAEMISLIKIAGPRFQSLGLNPTWLVGDTTTPSALVSYATPILQDATARQYIGAISYHSWGAFNYADSVFQGIANLGAQYNLPVWCEEVGYDSQLYLTPSTFQTWTYATKLAQTYQKILKLSKATVADYWEYQNDYGLTSNSSSTNPTLYPAYFVVKQLADNLKPGAQIVSTSSNTSTLQTMGARDVTSDKFFLQLINTSTQPEDVVINGLPSSTLTLLRSRSGENNITVGTYNPANGSLSLTLPADSVSALTGTLSIPAPWSSNDIGSGVTGSSLFANGTYTIKGSGTGMTGSSDGLRFISQALDASGSITTRVDPTALPAGGQAGLMIRESTAAGAKMAALLLNSTGSASFSSRSATGATSTTSTTNAGAPYYLKLARSGNTFTASISSTGSSFTTIGTIDITMSGSARIGMAVTSNNNATLGIGTFTQVQVIANAPSAAPGQLVAVAPVETRVDLTWADNSGNEDGFKIERSPDGVNNWTQIVSLATPNASSYSDNTVVANTKYFYRIRAYNAVGNSAYSGSTSVTTPSGLYEAELTPVQSGVRLDTTWSGFTGTGFIDFVTANGAYIEFNVNAPTSGPYAMDIRYGLGVASPLRPLNISVDGVQVATGVSFPSASNWTTWMTYSLYANFSAGSHLIRLTDTGADGPNIDNLRLRASVPSSPGSFLAKASAGKMNLTWVDSQIETGYRIERSTDGVNFSQVASLGANVITWQDPSAVVATSYTYRIRAFNSVGDSSAQISTASIPTIPNAPTGLVATGISTTQIDLSWTDNSSNEDVFRIEISTNGSTFSTLANTSSNVKTYSATGLTPGQQYWFRVFALNGGGNSPYSNTVNAFPAGAIATPTGVSALTVSTTQINVTWGNVANETGYIIESSPDGTNGWAQVGTTGVDIVTFSHTNLTAGTTYFYRVKASGANGPSAPSTTASATTTPAAPSLTSATPVSTTQINLIFTNVTGETQYLIERSPNGSSGWTQVGTAPLNSTTFSDINLTASTQYFYRVKATGAGGTSTASNSLSATTLAPVLQAAPTSLTATAASTTQINLSWPDTSTETQYLIEQSTNGTSGWAQIGTTGANVTTFNAIALAPGTIYYFQVKAVGPNGTSAPSPIANATTTPAAPALLTAAPFSTSRIDLTWSNVAGETQYLIERSSTGTGAWTQIATTLANVTSYSNINLNPGETWFYRVKASGAGGTSVESNVLSATTNQGAPTSLTATTASISQINLSWLDTANETQYLIERSPDGTSGWTQIGTTLADVTTYNSIGLSPGTLYFYQVKAVGPGGTSAASASASATTTPAAPGSLGASAVSTSQINLTWIDVTGETQYLIERSADGIGGWLQVGTAGANVNTFSNINLSPSETWYYQVKAVGAGGTSDPSNVSSATTFALPQAAPTSLTATTASSSQINLSWPDTANETQFLIERSPNGTTGWTQIATTLADVTTYNNIGLTSGTTFFYQVKAVGPNGTSTPSPTASASTTPLAPATVTATTASASQINLTWPDATGETQYLIERSPDGTNGWAQVGSVGVNVLTFSNTGLTSATPYFYRVKSVGAGGTSTPGPTATATTTPAAPASLTVAAASSTQINLGWADVAGESQYLIERSADGVNGWTQVGTTPANVLTFNNTGLTAGTTYYYRVKADGVGGASAASNVANATTTSTGMPAPTMPIATVISPTQITLTWVDNATTETGYAVERSNDGTTYTSIANLAANITTYTDTVAAKTTNYYRVRATGATNSAWALAFPVTTPGALGSTISGTVFQDDNANGIKEASEPALVKWIVYLDTNNNSSRDATEASIATSATGTYSFGALLSATYKVRIIQQPGYVYTVPSTGLQTVTIASRASASNINFGNAVQTITSLGPDTLGVEIDPIPIDVGGEITTT